MIASGCINNAHIEIYLKDDENSDSAKVLIRLLGLEKSIRIEKQWPGDFNAKELNGDTRRLLLPIPQDLLPLVSVEIKITNRLARYGGHWYLRLLYPKTEQEFEKMFYRGKRRVQHAETLLFSLEQVLASYRLNVLHEAVAAVVCAYRLIDRGDMLGLARLTDKIQDILPRLHSAEQYDLRFPLSSPGMIMRRDRDHQRGSLLTALWLVLLAQGRFDEFLTTLDEYIEQMIEFDPDGSSTLILNGCLAILLCAYMHQLLGNVEKANKFHLFNHTFYVRHLPRMTPHATWFKEMQMAHNAVALSLGCHERILNGQRLIEPMLIFQASHRVYSDTGKSLLEAKFCELCRILQLKNVDNSEMETNTRQ